MLTLLIKNPNLKISGVILHNPCVVLPSSPPLKVNFWDRLEIRNYPKSF